MKEQKRRRHVTPTSTDYGLRTAAMHNPSSGYSYSDAESYEWDRSMNPNVRYIPGENNKDLGRVWSQEKNYSGRGPKNYRRRDETIFEDVCEVLSRNPYIDASEITVDVEQGTVFLDGVVETKRIAHLATELVQNLPGVINVENDLQIIRPDRDRRRMSRSLG